MGRWPEPPGAWPKSWAGSTYGRLLLVKLALVALAGAMGAWNRFRLVPAVERPGAAEEPWRG